MRSKQEESGWREMSDSSGEIESPKSRDFFLMSHVKRSRAQNAVGTRASLHAVGGGMGAAPPEN